MAETNISNPPKWETCLWLLVLLLTLAVLLGAAIGAIKFIPWRQMW